MSKLKIFTSVFLTVGVLSLVAFFTLSNSGLSLTNPVKEKKPRIYTQLDHLIGPEIKNDRFYNAIQKLAATQNVKTILEIGSSSGGGSTEAFVLGIKQNPNRPNLFCMEVSKARFAELQRTYSQDSFVKCYNVSSVSLNEFPTEDEVTTFYNTIPTRLNINTLPAVIGWLRQDVEYVQVEDVPASGIELIKAKNNIKNFDMVLIDGSEFLGVAELKHVYGANFILLDDVLTFKNFLNRKQLLSDPDYELIEEDLHLRNGFSIFKKKSFS